MYQPEHFKVEDVATIHGIMRAYPLAQLVTSGPGGLMANPVPFILKADCGSHGVLEAHLARPNAQWREIEAGAEVLEIFQGVDAYVTPSWYASKRVHGKVVPTWNYVVVQARGVARTIHDGQWLKDHVSALSDVHEAPRPSPWGVGDAPESFITALTRGIVGIEITIIALDGKAKLSQNRDEPDRAGVSAGFAAENATSAAAMAPLMADSALKRS